MELVDFQRSVRPSQQILGHLVDDDQLSAPTRSHLGNTLDSVSDILVDAATLSEMCKNLQDSHERLNDKQTNDILC